MMQVRKRNGDVVPHDHKRIESTVTNAAASIGRELTGEQIITVISKINELFNPYETPVQVEAIQDAVQVALMQIGEYKVAEAYILYRYKRLEGGSGSELYRHCIKLLRARNLDTHMFTKEYMSNRGASAPEFDIIILSLRPCIQLHYKYSEVAGIIDQMRINDEVKRTVAKYQPPSECSANLWIGEKIGLLQSDFWQLDLLAEIAPYDILELDYVGTKTLSDRYLLRDRYGNLIETIPQLFMRVAIGVSDHKELTSADNSKFILEVYAALTSKLYMHSTPTLFNALSVTPQLSSCYVSTTDDSLSSIFKVISDNAHMQKWAGGVGNDWANVRALGSKIKGTNGVSQGVIPFLKIVNDTAVAVNQGGKRHGSVSVSIEPWHPDIYDFLDLRRETGDDRRRAHDINTQLWVPDLFMERARDDKEWLLICPSVAPDLHETFGEDFVTRYESYETQVKNGHKEGKFVSAKALMRKILSTLFETGHPWLIFKDAANRGNTMGGMIHSTNLCTEIFLPTSKDMTAVCNLASLNLGEILKYAGGGEDFIGELRRLAKLAVRALNNVIDNNFYPTVEGHKHNKELRPIGLGIMGFHDYLMQQGLRIDSEEAANHARLIQMWIHDAALEESIRLGGGKKLNGTLTAIAPTATIAKIVGCSQSIEPLFENIYVQSTLSGEFTVVNKYLVDDLEREGLWSPRMAQMIKEAEGDIQGIEEIPADIRNLYPTAFQVDPFKYLDTVAARQPFICQGQSVNIYLAKPDGKKLWGIYFYAWQKGLKSTYYLRAKAASRVEQSTSDNLTQLSGNTSVEEVAPACYLRPGDPGFDECESCQ